MKPPFAGFLNINGWAGRTSQPVDVVGETPKKYRIEAAYDDVRLGGRNRILKKGEQALVPKYAISYRSES